MTLAKPINKYIDYIDAPEDTFEQYVEKARKVQLSLRICEPSGVRDGPRHARGL